MRIHWISALALLSAASAGNTSGTSVVLITTDTNSNPGATSSTTSSASSSSSSLAPSTSKSSSSSSASPTTSSQTFNAAESAIHATNAYVESILLNREALYSFLQNTDEAFSFYETAYQQKYGSTWSQAILSDLNKITASTGASSIMQAYETLVPQITANPVDDTARYESLLADFASVEKAWLLFFTPSASSSNTEGQAVVSWVTATVAQVSSQESMLQLTTTASKGGSASVFVPLFGVLGGIAVVLF